MGLWTGENTKDDFWPKCPSSLMVIAAVIGFCLGIFVLVKEAL
jgi:hypothetical protein